MFSNEQENTGRVEVQANDSVIGQKVAPKGAKMLWVTHLLVRCYGNATDFDFFINSGYNYKTEVISGSVTASESRTNLIQGIGESLIVPKKCGLEVNVYDQSGNTHDFLVQFYGTRILWF